MDEMRGTMKICDRCGEHPATQRFTSPVVDGWGSDYLVCEYCAKDALKIMDWLGVGFELFSLVSPEDDPKHKVQLNAYRSVDK